ncbi:MAG: hypothetical protein KDB27_34870, partial [Planctomycetales bacterium]|nr:hypothetical protein [Planctomycetales bacterium]
DVRPTRKSIAQNLRRLLRSQKLTSSDIAQRSNLDASTIQQVLDGEIDLPDDEAAAIAGAMQRPVDRLQKPKVSSVAISHDGHFALTAVADDRTVRLWDLENLTEIHPDSSPTKPLLELNNRQLWSAAFGNDSETIVTLGGSEARIWNRQTGKEQLNLSPHGTVVSARFTPDDRHVVTASWDDTAKIWDTSSGLAIRKLAGQHQGNVNMALFSPDGKHVLTCSDDRTALLWNAETGEPTGITLTGHGAAVTSAAFSLDGSRIVTASRDQCARVWNSQTGELIMHLHDPSLPNQQSHELGVLCVTYFHSSDGDFVATGGEDGTVKIWKAETGELLKRLDAHTARVTSVNASPDGSRLATASQDTTAKIWDSARGKEVLTLRGHTQEVTSVTFSPDGQKVLTASRDGLAIIWPADDWENAPTANTEVTEHETPSL